MPRLAKAAVHNVLDRVAERLVEAGGKDGRVSRADAKTAVGELNGVEKVLTDMFYRFVDHRDSAPRAVVTKSDVEETLSYAKDRLVDAYDINRNGLSNNEIAKMSTIGKLAARMARELATAEPVELPLPFDENMPLPEGWTPAMVVDQGTVDKSSGTLALAGLPAMDADQAAITETALDQMWDYVLVHRYWDGPVELGNRGNGSLRVGEYTDPRNGTQYAIADWKDIDDGSFTFYLRKQDDGSFDIVHEVYNN